MTELTKLFITHFSAPLIGGIIIGLSGILFLLFNGRIAGISGILRTAFCGGDARAERIAFAAGLIITGGLLYFMNQDMFQISVFRPLWFVAVAGFLVGTGTVIGNGCTSGHGVCGLGSFSLRSLVSVIIFLLFGIVTVYFTRGISW